MVFLDITVVVLVLISIASAVGLSLVSLGDN
jgi:hypothetical protein